MAKKKRIIQKKTTSISKKPKRKFERFSDGPSGKILPPQKNVSDEWDDDDGIEAREDAAIEEAKATQDTANIPHIKYPPPRRNNVFIRKWKAFIGLVTNRDNFQPAHLSQLEVLCDLYVEYEELKKFLFKNGYSYEAYGRQGKAIKAFPEVAQLNRTKAEIRNYSKILGLILTKDIGKPPPGEGGEWE